MTDNEIVKALECCMGCACKECHYHNDADIYDVTCKDRLIIGALDLINRQKAEIERLKGVLDNECDSCACVLLDQRDSARVEAIKEFAERLKDELKVSTLWGLVSFDRIDNLVKEMTEGNSNGKN